MTPKKCTMNNSISRVWIVFRTKTKLWKNQLRIDSNINAVHVCNCLQIIRHFLTLKMICFQISALISPERCGFLFQKLTPP